MGDIRWALAIMALAGAGGVVACESTTAPPADGEFRGILAWIDPPAFARAQTGQTGWEGTEQIEPPALQAPDTVEAGKPFAVTVTTILPNGCWEQGGTEIATDGNLATIDVFDRGPREADAICTLVYGWASRAVELEFRQEGEATIRLVGRRLQGESYQEETRYVVERTVIVRSPG